MSAFTWQIMLGAVLTVVSVAIYLIQIIFFDSPRDTLFYLFQDLAFVPIQVLLVTLILNQLLTLREKRILLKQLNMAIGVFFSEVGTGLLRIFLPFDPDAEQLGKQLLVTDDWTEEQFVRVKKSLSNVSYPIDSQRGNLEELQRYLGEKRVFLLGLLQNPNLLEHEAFTDMLWAVFHLAEELANRDTIHGLPDKDYDHLSVDLARVYFLLIQEWLAYLKHLQSDYPYLFSLAIRQNPFNRQTSIIVE